MLEYRLAQLTALATFALLTIGATVNPTGSSLACPEPTLLCHGQLFPEMVGGILYEHGHRLTAMTVGLLQIALTWVLWRRRRDLRWLGIIALVAVCLQGALGALTVYLGLSWMVSLSHLALGSIYFAILLLIAFRTRPVRSAKPAAAGLGYLRGWIVGALVVVFAQILLGGLMRHSGAALACLDLPLCHGQLFPSGASSLVLIHMSHRVGGLIVAAVVVISGLKVIRSGKGSLRVLAFCALGLVFAQILLGVWTILSFRHTAVAVAHFVGAEMLWAVWILMLLKIGRVASQPVAQEESRWTSPALLPS